MGVFLIKALPFDALLHPANSLDHDGRKRNSLFICNNAFKILRVAQLARTPWRQIWEDGESGEGAHTQRGEEPTVLAAGVTLLKHLLNVLLGIFTLADLLEGVVGNGALEALELKGVAGGHQVVVVDDLDEGLDLGALLLASLGHPAGDLLGVALDTGDQGVTEGVRLVAIVDGLDDDDLRKCMLAKEETMRRCKSAEMGDGLRNSYLLAGISAAGDDGDTADLEELHFASCVVVGDGGRWVVVRG